MSIPLSPAVMLATSMQSQPGVYAVLLGSGVSTGAGVPTGWGVVRELVRRIAAIEDPESLSLAESEPELWWQEHHGGELGYASLLEALAPTPASRQGILAEFFEPTDDERAQGLKGPSKAHLAIAQLVKRGVIKVVLTTNFDRLMEQALDAVGVAAQVISRPEAVAGMKPLAHATATVIKLHGDYLDLGSRNTPTELAEYPPEWSNLVAHVLDEYGLVISGWSAEWDTALVALMEGAPNRRYPLYWDSRSSSGQAAVRLLTNRCGHVVEAASADEMMTDLASNITTLETLAEPPLTTAMAVGRLKRYLTDAARRVDLYDLVMAAVDQAGERVQRQPTYIATFSTEDLESIVANHQQGVAPLLHLLANGVWHDTKDEHADLWIAALQRLIDASTKPLPSCTMGLEFLRLYSSVLAQATIGIAALGRHNERILLRTLTETRGRPGMAVRDDEVRGYELLDPSTCLSREGANNLSRMRRSGWIFPMSRLIRDDVRAAFSDLVPDDQAFVRLEWGWEYRLALVQASNGAYPYFGDSGGEAVWYGDGVPPCEKDFLERQLVDRNWPWTTYLGGEEKQASLMSTHRAQMREAWQRLRFN